MAINIIQRKYEELNQTVFWLFGKIKSFFFLNQKDASRDTINNERINPIWEQGISAFRIRNR